MPFALKLFIPVAMGFRVAAASQIAIHDAEQQPTRRKARQVVVPSTYVAKNGG
jgi:hypothetical protein